VRWRTSSRTLPVYRRVARESPHGEGSIAMLERVLPWWGGKLFVLILLGFAATDFTITMTLSAADASAHILENPYSPAALDGHAVAVTLLLLAVLGAIFLKGFREAISLAVVLVGLYVAVNVVVVAIGMAQVVGHPGVFSDWTRLLASEHPSWLAVAAVALLSLGLRRTLWLVVPILWPSAQPNYKTMTIPALSPLIAAFWAIPIPGMTLAGLIAEALVLQLRRRRELPRWLDAGIAREPGKGRQPGPAMIPA
jgi:hypothetical protein